MHICFITHEYPKKGRMQGGIGSVVQTLGRALIKSGFSVSVVGISSLEKDTTEEDNGVQIYRLKASTWKFLRFYQNKNRLLEKIKKIHQKNPLDIIEGSELNFAFFPKEYFAKKVIRLHGGHNFFAKSMGKKPAFWRSYQEKKSFEKADALVSVSNYVGSKTKELIGFNKSFATIYNLVDTNKFFEADQNKIIPQKLVFVGTITEKKGIRQLVQAMPKIIKNYPNTILDIIGRDWFDPQTKASYTDYLKTFITDDIKSHINFIGPLQHEEIPKKLESAEVCVYPSHLEAQGIVVVEAMSMAKATIFSTEGPGSEMITENKTGLLCNPFTPDSIAGKIIYMFDNPQKAIDMGKNARIDILKRFNYDNILKQNIEFYRSCI